MLLPFPRRGMWTRASRSLRAKPFSARPGKWWDGLEQVEKPGQFVTASIAGEPIVVVRGNDGVLRGFYNVCRHHAAAVVTEPCGQASILHCPYHGWNYGLDGSLKGMPEFDGVKNFERQQNGLVPVKAETWEKFVFVNLDPQAAPLNDFLGGLVKRVAPLQCEQAATISTAAPMTSTATGKYLSITTSTADTTFRICTKG